MTKKVSKPRPLPSYFDPVLNLSYNINRFYDFISKSYNATEVQEALKGLYQLKNEKRRLQLISSKKYTEEAIKSLKMFCEYLTHTHKGFTYFCGAASRDGIYDCYCKIFKDKKAPANIKQIAVERFIGNNYTLVKTGFFDLFDKNEDYNYIFYYDKYGVISTREIPAMLDILFNCTMRDEISVLLAL